MSSKDRAIRRRYPIGAELISPGHTHFRVWAPRAKRLEVVLHANGNPEGEPTYVELAREEDGHFSGEAPAGVGALYRYRLDGDSHSYPDPVSRSLPHGPHKHSGVVDPSTFRWTDEKWRGRPIKGAVMYEMHIGTFTPEGTWAAAAKQLPELASLGVNVVEMMPVAEFAGEHNWGYDGVSLFAPTHLYGTPDDLRAFNNAAHAAGIAVILDVVYNHFGPEGNYMSIYSKDYLTDRYKTDWGEPINFDGPNSGPVREFFLTNARYWIEEFHFDGFRFDATQSIFDASDEYILAAISRVSREAANGRDLILVAENEPQATKIVRPHEEGGDGLDGLWNDDLHHSALVTLTGRWEGYYVDYRGKPQEYISAAKYGYLYQGQYYNWHKGRRGTSSFGLPPAAFVGFIENHDQVANSGEGKRIRAHTSPGRYRAMTALLLLGPWTPMLFQGQEFGTTSDFLYFNDVCRELQDMVRKGRAESLKAFASCASPEIQKRLADPFEPSTFTRCKLDFTERETHADLYAMHRNLLKLRREEPAFSAQRIGGVDGAVLGPDCFVLRFFGDVPGGDDDRLLLVNFGKLFVLAPVAEPLLAPPLARDWTTAWTSESPLYGGPGAVPVETLEGWRIPAESAVVLKPVHDTGKTEHVYEEEHGGTKN